MALITAHLNAGVILAVTHCHRQNDSCIKMGSDESHLYIYIPLPTPPYPPPPSPSLISLMVSVDVKHHVDLLTPTSLKYIDTRKVAERLKIVVTGNQQVMKRPAFIRCFQTVKLLFKCRFVA